MNAPTVNAPMQINAPPNVDELKTRFFELAEQEDIGNTPRITAELDLLQAQIRMVEIK